MPQAKHHVYGPVATSATRKVTGPSKPESELPGFIASVSPVLLPILLIGLGIPKGQAARPIASVIF